MTKYFSMPADFKKETIDGYYALNKEYRDCKVIETYGQITVDGWLGGSGRLLSRLPKIDISALEDYISYSKERNIDFNYTINSSFLQNREFTKEGITEIKNFLGELYQAGVRWLTIALPSLIEIVKSTDYEFRIKASTICQITNANKAMWFKCMGVDRIVLDESINREFNVLKNIAKGFGDKVEVIVNSICHKDCVNRIFHYNQISGDAIEQLGNVSNNYYPARCEMKKYEDLSNWMKTNWIRPEDLKYYIEIGINHFKIQGRHSVVKGDPVRAVKCYFEESYEGNLLDLMGMFVPTNQFLIYINNKNLDGFIKPFVDNKDFCCRDCGNCGYCETYAKKSIDYAKSEEISKAACMYLNQQDKFKRLLDNSKNGEL